MSPDAPQIAGGSCMLQEGSAAEKHGDHRHGERRPIDGIDSEEAICVEFLRAGEDPICTVMGVESQRHQEPGDEKERGYRDPTDLQAGGEVPQAGRMVGYYKPRQHESPCSHLSPQFTPCLRPVVALPPCYTERRAAGVTLTASRRRHGSSPCCMPRSIRKKTPGGVLQVRLNSSPIISVKSVTQLCSALSYAARGTARAASHSRAVRSGVGNDRRRAATNGHRRGYCEPRKTASHVDRAQGGDIAGAFRCRILEV